LVLKQARFNLMNPNLELQIGVGGEAAYDFNESAADSSPDETLYTNSTGSAAEKTFLIEAHNPDGSDQSFFDESGWWLDLSIE
jgi:hypothetical protein